MNANSSVKKRCLLILPRSFYSFADVVERGLQDLGYATVVANDEYPESMLGKIISKLGLPLARTITRRVLKQKYLDGQHYDLVLVIKGRGLDEETAAELCLCGDQVVGYHFDSFGYDRGPARWRNCVPRVCTFDYKDSADHKLPVVELFTSMPKAIESCRVRYKVSAIMRNHSGRLKYLDEVMRAFDHQRSFLYIFEANLITCILNIIRHPLLYFKYRKYISRKPLPYDDYVQVIADSEFTIDYAHPKQTGITIRCFEALSTGTRLITNNPFIKKCSLFDVANFIIFSSGEDTEILRRSVTVDVLQKPVSVRRTVEDFLLDLIEPFKVKDDLK